MNGVRCVFQKGKSHGGDSDNDENGNGNGNGNVNGSEGKMYLYYTNSRRGTFARFVVDANGLPVPGAAAQLVDVLPGYEDGEHL